METLKVLLKIAVYHVAVFPLLSTTWPSISAADEGKTIGLVITDRQYAIYQTADGSQECPSGMQFSNAANWRAQFPTEAEQQQHLRLFGTKQNRGPNGENVWLNPEVIKDPLPIREATGNTAVGLDLDGTSDGRSTNATCAHGKFKSPDAKTNVDNQLFRVLGCQVGYRNPGGADGFVSGFRRKYVREDPINRLLIEISGIDDELNDADVLVRTYRGLDKLAEDAYGKIFPGQSQRIDREAPEYFYEMNGQIINGELVTETIDMEIPESFFLIAKKERIYAARLRLKLTQSGATGLLGGYTDVKQFWEIYAKQGQSTDELRQISGPTTYEALWRLADGHKDPATGVCKAISTAYKVEFTRAYIMNPKP